NRISSSGKFEIAPHARLRTAANRTGKFENADPTRVGDNLPKRRRKLDCGGWESPSALKLGYPESAACGSGLRRAYRPDRSCGRVAEGGGLLNRYRVVKPYRGFESLRLRHRHYSVLSVIRITCNSRSSRRGASRCIAMPLL